VETTCLLNHSRQVNEKGIGNYPDNNEIRNTYFYNITWTTMDEILDTMIVLPSENSPGLDGIQNKIVQLVVTSDFQIFTHVFMFVFYIVALQLSGILIISYLFKRPLHG